MTDAPSDLGKARFIVQTGNASSQHSAPPRLELAPCFGVWSDNRRQFIHMGKCAQELVHLGATSFAINSTIIDRKW